MQTLFHIIQIILELVILYFLVGQLISDTKTIIKGLNEGSDEQNGDHTLQDEQK